MYEVRTNVTRATPPVIRSAVPESLLSSVAKLPEIIMNAPSENAANM
jgi:hypothetical protein